MFWWKTSAQRTLDGHILLTFRCCTRTRANSHPYTATGGYAIRANLLRYYLGGHKLRHQRHTHTHIHRICSDVDALEQFSHFISFGLRLFHIFVIVSFSCVDFIIYFLRCSFPPTWQSCYSHFLVKMSMVRWWATSIDSSRNKRNRVQATSSSLSCVYVSDSKTCPTTCTRHIRNAH